MPDGLAAKISILPSHDCSNTGKHAFLQRVTDLSLDGLARQDFG